MVQQVSKEIKAQLVFKVLLAQMVQIDLMGLKEIKALQDYKALLVLMVGPVLRVIKVLQDYKVQQERLQQ